MISQETIRQLAQRYRTTEYPNIVREYFQHVFLSRLYTLPRAEQLLFKGGTALRIIYGSPRFSEDIDFTLYRVAPHEQKAFVESLFTDVLAHIESLGIYTELGPKPDTTKEGYYGEATFSLYEYQPVVVSINVFSRNGRTTAGEIESIANEFVPVYNLYHMKQFDLIDEKIDALFDRKKARDFYDIYFVMRKNLLTNDHKQRLAGLPKLLDGVDVRFQDELSAFLPMDQHSIIRDFQQTLLNELQRQLSI